MPGHKSRLIRFAKSEDTDEAQKQTLQEELHILEPMLEQNRNQRQKFQTDLELQGQLLRDIRIKANAEVEEAFIHARLWEVEDDYLTHLSRNWIWKKNMKTSKRH